MFCRNCGNQVPNGSTYCAGCGSSLRMAPAVGLSNPGAGGYSYQGAGGYNNPIAGGYGNPAAGGYGNPAAGGYGNPAAGGYGNPGAGGYSNSNAYGNNYAPNSGYANQGLSVDPDIALRTLTSKLRTSANLWTAIGIYQIFMGIILLIFGYGVLSLILGIWNIVQSSKARKNAAYFQSNPVGIVSFFEAGKSSTIIGVIVNLVFGAIFGVIGSIYDLSIDNYVLSHRDAFAALERR